MTNAQSHSEPKYVAEPQTFPLWDHAAPGAVGNTDEDKPSVTNYSPVMPGETRTAVIVAPGGSYHFLASNHEGRQVANWLNAMGVTAFVLKYRLGPRYHHPIELGDAQRAIRLVRSRAAEFGVAPMVGSASTPSAATLSPRAVCCRPDLATWCSRRSLVSLG